VLPLCAFMACSKVKFTFTLSDCKNFYDDLKEKSGQWEVKQEALDCTKWRTRFGRGCRHVDRKTIEQMNEWIE